MGSLPLAQLSQGRHQLFWSGAAVKQGVELEFEVICWWELRVKRTLVGGSGDMPLQKIFEF